MTRPEFPGPVERFVRAATLDGEPNPQTVRIEGRGRFRRRPLPWLPMKVRIHLVPGSDRVQELRVGVGPITPMRVLDAFVDGRGITKAPGAVDVGPEIDQGAFHPVVIETMLLPGTWPRIQGLRWEPVDAAAARLRVPFRDGTEAATVVFDEGTGCPSSYRVPRFKSRGPKVGWRVDFREWGRIAGIAWPRRVVVTWADEPGPWYVLRTDRVELDVDADDALNRARVALAEAS